jgi:phosphomethylpyrimidine synthase
VLEPGEIHRLASKTRRAMGAREGHKASCHSDQAEPVAAQRLQSEALDPLTLEPLGAPPAA